jgi:cytoskeleton protein RodZ
VARSIGERLRAGRERSGLSIAAAAEKLHLDPRIIEALEGNRFAEVGVPVYVRGHLKRYGDFVGEPGAELVNLYNARETRASAPDLTQVPHPDRRADPRRLARPLLVLGGAAALAGAIWWVLAGPGASRFASPRAVTTPVVSADASPVNAPAVRATPAALSNAALPAEAAPPVEAPAREASPAPTPAPAPVAEPAKEAPAREIHLRLELTGDSWVEIYDSRGERLFYDVASAGSVQSVSGRGPLRVVLGNAAGVGVQVDGQAREIPANAVDGDGARFVVNRSGTLSRAR